MWSALPVLTIWATTPQGIPRTLIDPAPAGFFCCPLQDRQSPSVVFTQRGDGGVPPSETAFPLSVSGRWCPGAGVPLPPSCNPPSRPVTASARVAGGVCATEEHADAGHPRSAVIGRKGGDRWAVARPLGTYPESQARFQ